MVYAQVGTNPEPRVDFSQLNWPAILVATVAAFGLGGVWYGPLFGKAWQKLVGLSDEQLQQGSPAKTFGGAFVLTLVMATALALLLQLHPAPDLLSGANIGVLLGICLIATSIGINYLFARRALALYLIEAGYMVALMTLLGAILGAWR
jgi:hypothetical protein